MSLRLPSLETDRLVIRDFRRDDLNDVHRILDREIDLEGNLSIETRRHWLEWSIMNYGELAGLYQPPYGDRAVTLRDTDELIGVTGYSPMLHPLSEMLNGKSAGEARWLPEMGLYYAFAPAHRGNGYATEAAQALIDYAFEYFHLKRIVANTEFANLASQGVMKKLGMTLHRNETGEPEWFEVLGVLEQSQA
ncbi:MAG: N-acetyltransferase [Chloroflexi bacterium]|nr:MAG: N-acetyltransferase [Chloroflexota bacterium]